MNDFYVYLHRRKTDGKVFYVGKGKGKRAQIKSGRTSKWKNVVNKHGYFIEIAFDNLDEETAFAVEKDTILEFKYFGHDLCNFTNGGEGTAGIILSEETKRKLSIANTGKVRTESHRRNLSIALKGKTKNPASVEKMRISNTGKKQSEETKAKRRKTLKEVGTSNDRHIYVFFSKTDVFVGTRKELSEYTKIDLKKFKPLFEKNYVRSAQGWSVLNVKTLLILKEIQNANRY